MKGVKEHIIGKMIATLLLGVLMFSCAVAPSEKAMEFSDAMSKSAVFEELEAAEEAKAEESESFENGALLENNFKMSAGELSDEQLEAFKDRARQKLSDYFDIVLALLLDTTINDSQRKDLQDAGIDLFNNKRNKVLNFGIDSKLAKRSTIETFMNAIESSKRLFISLPFKTDSITKAEYAKSLYHGNLYVTISVNDQDISLQSEYIIDKAVKVFGEDEEVIWSVYLGNQSFLK